MNVLSVDLDFLFTDMTTIQKFMDTDLKPRQSWKVIEWKSGIKDFKPCQKSARFLDILLNKCLKPSTKVESITEHEEIIKVMEKHKVEEADIFNIDYHHDISYGNSDEELNIENWVLFGKKKGIIKNYYWITQPDAKVCKDTVMSFKQSYWGDLDLDKMPKFDLIVFCTSKHFTPPKYWGLNKQILRETFIKIDLLKTCFGLENFRLVDEKGLDDLPIEKYPNFFCGEKNKSDYLFHYNKCYVDVYIDENTGVPFLSMINLGEPSNIFKIKNVTDFCLKVFGVIGFYFVTGIKNESYIRRLSKNYRIIKEFQKENKTTIILKR